jgi:pimeloyl-ACP methyl ester carboxylesterase
MRLVAVLLTAVLFGFAPSVRAEEVSIEYEGLGISADLSIAPGKSIRGDGVVLLVHDTLAHDRVEPLASLQEALRDLGVNSLAITLGLGLDNRHGMYDCNVEQDHRHEDAVDEIATWVSYLKEKGAASITLFGHGRGANQVALYSINRLDRAVKRLVLAAPLMQTPEKAEAEYQAKFHRPLKDELAKAEEYVANEQGNQLIDVPGFLSCPKARVTAGAFADYYGANPKFQTLNLLPSLKVPALLVIGDQDPALPEIEEGRAQFSSIRGISLQIIPGADHDFRDQAADELAKKIKDYLVQRPQG